MNQDQAIEAEAATSSVGSPSEEYERQPVPTKARLGFKSFIGMYAGEHCAGTELMIGPLFVAAGVSAFDLVVGLLLGNALAVLSWMFLTAPIATRSRMTLYYQLEKICGPWLVRIYNLANGVMFCFLAGAMITVSATAVGVWFDIPMPALDAIFPGSVGYVLAVLAVGGVIAVVAAYGYQTVAKFANIASPWMVLVFLAFGFVALRQFMDAGKAQIQSAGDLWALANTEIWPGGEALAGQTKFTLWHVMFFSWFTNMAHHIGMGDLSVLRYAKKSWYAIASSAGMYVGHFMAWISASMLYAYQLNQDPSNTSVAPGPLAYQAAGIAGLICVIVAGWTTANPTIYRAGLAFQGILPRAPRFLMTLVAGLLATGAGLFPGVAMKLLGFVALYGMLLMPMGAIIFVDYWLLKKFGLSSYYAEVAGKRFNWAAGATWFITLTLCGLAVKIGTVAGWLQDLGVIGQSTLTWLVDTFAIQVYFVSLPGWFAAAIMYIVLSKLYQAKIRPSAASEAKQPSAVASGVGA
jgi:purine-cytosine permease-like protein